MLNHAIEYLRRGWSIIPIAAGGKTSPIRWKDHQTRQAGEEEVRSWFKKWPDAGLAIVTGGISGLVVLDVDGADGANSIKDKELPPTLCVKTSQGAHYYFVHPGFFVSGHIRFLPGCDLRGDGNYVVCPPSLHPSGMLYEWAIKEPPAEIPKWLLEIIEAKRKEDSKHRSSGIVELPDKDIGPADWFQAALDKGVKEGERNKTGTRLVGRWLGLGMTAGECWFMLQRWNEKNTPPMPESELRTTLESIVRLETNKKIGDDLATGDADPKQFGHVDPMVLCQSLSEHLEVNLKRIIKFKTDPPRYAVILGDAKEERIDVSDVNELIDQHKMRLNLARYANKQMKRFKQKVWDNVVQMILLALEEQEVGDEGDKRLGLQASVLHYLSELKPITDEDKIEGVHPFWFKGKLFIRSVPFRLYLKRTLGEVYSTAQLAGILRSLDCHQIQVWHPQRGSRTNTRCWEMSKQIVDLMNGVEKKGKG